MSFISRAVALWFIAITVAHAQTASIVPSATTYAPSGGTLSFTVRLEYPADVSALGFEIGTVPAGWSYRSASGDDPPQVTPAANQTESFGFAYTTVPSQAAQFVFTVAYPAGLSGSQRFAAISANFRSPLRQVAVPDLVLTPATVEPPIAPTITSQPSGATVSPGANVTLSVSAAGTAPLSYQWRKDNAVISGATSASLVLTNVTAVAAGNYTVVISNSAGSVTSAIATIAVTSGVVAPQIITAPASQSVRAGETATLSVSATGTAPLSYQWRKDGVALNGATSATLTLTNVPVSAQGAYSVVVSNAAGSITSAAATLTVIPVSEPETPTSGVWFGSFNDNAGTFALLLRPDRTGVFLGYLRQPRALAISRAVTIDSRRAVLGVMDGFGGQLDASVGAGGALTGAIAGNTLRFSSPGPAAGASTQALAGYYHAGTAGGRTVSHAIAGPNGTLYVALPADESSDAGTGTLSVAGAIVVATENGGRVGGAINGVNATIALQYSPASGPAVTFSGANDEARGDVEKLINLSTRGRVGGSAGELTAGFVLIGDQPKALLVRGIGPSLTGFGLSGALSAARLEIFRVTGGSTSIASGADWGAGPEAAAIATAANRVGAFALPGGSRDAALLVTLDPGAYTAVVSGQGGASGVALVEIYDATAGTIPRARRLINISTRAMAGSGDDALVAGFVVRGDVPKQVLVRGAGPALERFGLSGVLAAPQLTLRAGETLLARNAGWSSSAAEATAISAAGRQVGAFAFATGSRDAALLINLMPGLYTAQIASEGSPGIALLEVYEVP